MTNTHLQVNKDLFNLGLNPTEIIILAQVMEWKRTTGDCFESDKSLAGKLSVSEKTISRAMKELEDRGFIIRETKNIKGGRVRHITPNIKKIDEALTTTDKMTVVGDSQQTNCPLSTDNLTVVNGQNDFIKENIKEKRKDNSSDETISDCLHPHLGDCMSASSKEEFESCW